MIQDTIRQIRDVVYPYTTKFKKNVSIVMENNCIGIDFNLVKYSPKDKVFDKSDEPDSLKFAEELSALIIKSIPNHHSETFSKGKHFYVYLRFAEII